MRARNVCSVAGAAILIVIGAAPAESQGRTEWEYADEHHRNDCRLAHQVLTLGQPAKKRAWALSVAPSCGPLGGEALAHILREHRGDVAWTQASEDIVLAATNLIDRSLFETGLHIAADPSAGPVARVQAVRVVYHQFNPGVYEEYAGFVEGSSLKGLAVGAMRISSEPPARAEPLPVGRYDLAEKVMREIVGDPSAPAILRRAARRILESVEAHRRVERVCGVDADVWSEECSRRLDEDLSGPPPSR